MPRVAHVVEMVHRHRAQLGRHLGAAHVGELIGVEFRQQAVLQPRLQHPPALVHREGALLAEGVAEAGQLLSWPPRGIIFLTISFT